MRTSGDLNMAIGVPFMPKPKDVFLHLSFRPSDLPPSTCTLRLYEDEKLERLIDNWCMLVKEGDPDRTVSAPGMTFELDVVSLFLTQVNQTIRIEIPPLPFADGTLES